MGFFGVYFGEVYCDEPVFFFSRVSLRIELFVSIFFFIFQRYFFFVVFCIALFNHVDRSKRSVFKVVFFGSRKFASPEWLGRRGARRGA